LLKKALELFVCRLISYFVICYGIHTLEVWQKNPNPVYCGLINNMVVIFWFLLITTHATLKSLTYLTQNRLYKTKKNFCNLFNLQPAIYAISSRSRPTVDHCHWI